MSKFNKELLRLLNLPPVRTLGELGDALHLDPKRLKFIATESRIFYKRYQIPKRSGGLRLIEQPTQEVKAIQAWILRNILDRLYCSPHATAYLRGVSLLENVSPHEFNRYFLCVDIEDFFPSIGTGKILRFFRLIGYPEPLDYYLSLLCTTDGHLPQGGVTSPALSNLTSLLLDRRLSGLCAKNNVVYTRYADDMTFSSNNPRRLQILMPRISSIMASERFKINKRKIKFLGPDNSCRVTGLVKNSSLPTFGIGVKKKREMRAIMHRLLAGNPEDERYPTRASIEGWLSFLKSVDFKSYTTMEKYWNQLILKFPLVLNFGT